MGRVCVPKKRRFRNLFFRKKVVTRSLIRIETALKLHLPPKFLDIFSRKTTFPTMKRQKIWYNENIYSLDKRRDTLCASVLVIALLRRFICC